MITYSSSEEDDIFLISSWVGLEEDRVNCEDSEIISDLFFIFYDSSSNYIFFALLKLKR